MDVKMKKATTLSEVRATFESIEDNGDEWFSNLLASDGELTYWLNKGQVSVAATPTTAVLLRQRYGCQRCYFANVKREILAEDLLTCFEGVSGKIITTVMDRSGETEPIKEMLRQADFSHYDLLKYAMKIDEPEPPSSNGVIYAQETDLSAIDFIIKKNFDPLLDQNPDKDEILNAIRKNRVIIMRCAEDNQIAAFSAFERKGKTLWSRYLASLEEYRKYAPYGVLLFYQLLALHSDTQRVVCWIRQDNIVSRNMHQALGFQCDGLATEEYFLYSGE